MPHHLKPLHKRDVAYSRAPEMETYTSENAIRAQRTIPVPFWDNNSDTLFEVPEADLI